MTFSNYPVLIVDDDHSNRVVTEYTLGKHFEVFSTDSAVSALDIISNRPISVLLTDQKMPEMTGIDLSEKCIDINPDIVRILITAYSDLPMAIEAINRGHVQHFIKKPWTPDELTSIIRQSITQYENTVLLRKLQEEHIRMDRVRSLGVISAGIAHDMRQPLTYISHFLQCVNRDVKKAISINTNEDIGDALKAVEIDLEDISRGVDVLNTLSDNLLNHINNLPYSYERFSLKDIVDNVLSISKYAINERANLICDFPDPDVRMYSCKTRVCQVMLNLLLNASQSFSDVSADNNIHLKIFQNKNTVCIEVRDNGCGISDNIRKKIFEPLFSTKNYSGTGLGLSICKINVEELGGRIDVETKAGVGTKFLVELPLLSE